MSPPKAEIITRLNENLGIPNKESMDIVKVSLTLSGMSWNRVTTSNGTLRRERI